MSFQQTSYLAGRGVRVPWYLDPHDNLAMTIQRNKILKKFNLKLFIYILCMILPFILIPLAVSPLKESRCGYVMLLVALFWVLEPVPVAATALLPVVLFPLLGVVSSEDIVLSYMKETFMMFIGGLIIAIAVEDCNLHERIALRVLLSIGSDIKWLMLGFMSTTAFLSMWISNTATTAMMVPIVEAIVNKIYRDNVSPDAIQMEERNNTNENKTEASAEEDGEVVGPTTENKENGSCRVKLGLLLCVCYAANIGGTGTLTGTAPNLVFKGLVEDLYPKSDEITFATWMMYNIPGLVICVLIGWCYLWLIYIRFSDDKHKLASKESIKEVISKRYTDLGPIRPHEAQVMLLFVILVLLWIFRQPKFISGWADLIGSDTKIGDSVPAILVAFLMFFLPANPCDLGGRPILEWRVAQAKLPWGVILLAGGGYALADASKKSGLSFLVGEQLTALSILPPLAIVTVLCFMTAMVTEIMTNTTTATIFLPVFSQVAVSIGVNPLFLMLPVTVVCSYAFMLPVATPPNAIAFEQGNMKTVDMAKPGLMMNLICCSVQLFMINTLGVVMFDLNTFPDWADKANANMTSTNSSLPAISSLNGTLNLLGMNDTLT